MALRVNRPSAQFHHPLLARQTSFCLEPLTNGCIEERQIVRENAAQHDVLTRRTQRIIEAANDLLESDGTGGADLQASAVIPSDAWHSSERRELVRSCFRVGACELREQRRLAY